MLALHVAHIEACACAVVLLGPGPSISVSAHRGPVMEEVHGIEGLALCMEATQVGGGGLKALEAMCSSLLICLQGQHMLTQPRCSPSQDGN